DPKDKPPHERERPECHAQPANTFAKARGPEHGGSENDETCGQEEHGGGVQLIEHALGRLPYEGECRLVRRGCPGSMIEIGDRVESDLCGRLCEDHCEAEDG